VEPEANFSSHKCALPYFCQYVLKQLVNQPLVCSTNIIRSKWTM